MTTLASLIAQAEAKAAELDAAGAPYPRTLLEHLTPAAPATSPGAFVVRDLGRGYHPFVAHWRNDENPAKPYYIWGRYSETLAGVIASHLERLQRETRRAA